MRALFVFLVILFHLICPASASDNKRLVCLRQVCLKIVETSAQAEFRVLNQSSAPITFELPYAGENVWATTPSPVVVGIEEGEERVILVLKKQDPTKLWSWRYGEWNWARGLVGRLHDNEVIYRLPFISREAIKIIQGYHGAFSHQIKGGFQLDFDLPEQSSVVSAREGKVIELEASRSGFSENHPGNFILILHSDGSIGAYYHLRPQGVLVSVGQNVSAGQLIGYSGNTGYSTGPHLHFEVYIRESVRTIRTVPTRFHTSDGYVRQLNEGQSYRAP